MKRGIRTWEECFSGKKIKYESRPRWREDGATPRDSK